MTHICVTDLLTTRFDLYVPKKHMRAEFVSAVIKLAGGATQSEAVGWWINDQGDLFKNDVVIVTVFCRRSMPDQVLDVLEQEVRYLLEQGEETVALCRDNHNMKIYGLLAERKTQ